MAYALGIDLGTSYSAAAIASDDGVEMVQLGERSAAIPSLIHVRPDGELLVGEAADRRALSEPDRTAREFKRRLGDPIPLILGGTPFGPDALLAALLRAIVGRVADQLGKGPAHVVITHPASYGPFKLDLLRQAAQQAELSPVSFLSEPVAAAVHYASLERVPPGTRIAVYDFGGGTFDATVLRKSDDTFDVIGTPEGLERLGGIDFDEAVFRHVMKTLGSAAAGLDQADPSVQTGMARLREECRRAKEALSADSDTTIAVSLPGIQREVRITRSEFEAMIGPRIDETVAALARALASADLTLGDVDRILLVGGTSRIPRIAERVRAATGRQVAIDVHPKHAVALGAARLGLEALAGRPPVAEAGPAPEAAVERVSSMPKARQRRRAPVLMGLIGVIVAAALIASGAFLTGALSFGAAVAPPSPSPAAGVPTLPPAPAAMPTFPPGTGRPTARITGVDVGGGRYVVTFTTTGFTPAVGGTHVHFFWNTVDPAQAGSGGSGPYVVYAGGSPFADLGEAGRPAAATAICIIVANPDHTIVQGSGGCLPIP